MRLRVYVWISMRYIERKVVDHGTRRVMGRAKQLGSSTNSNPRGSMWVYQMACAESDSEEIAGLCMDLDEIHRKEGDRPWDDAGDVTYQPARVKYRSKPSEFNVGLPIGVRGVQIQ